jgi:hypothetical protein
MLQQLDTPSHMARDYNVDTLLAEKQAEDFPMGFPFVQT